MIVIDGAPTHALIKRALPSDFRTQEEHGGVPTAIPLTPRLREAVAAVLAAAADVLAAKAAAGKEIDSLLFARCDFLESGGELLLLELEAIEPQLFFRVASDAGGANAAVALAAAIGARLKTLS